MTDWRRVLEDVGIAAAASHSSAAARSGAEAARGVEELKWRLDELEQAQEAKGAHDRAMQKGSRFLALAEEARRSGDLATAAENYRIAIASYPDDAYFTSTGEYVRARCRLLRIQCLRMMGKKDEAVDALPELFARPIAIDADFERVLRPEFEVELANYETTLDATSINAVLDRIAKIDLRVAGIGMRLEDNRLMLMAKDGSVRARRGAPDDDGFGPSLILGGLSGGALGCVTEIFRSWGHDGSFILVPLLGAVAGLLVAAAIRLSRRRSERRRVTALVAATDGELKRLRAERYTLRSSLRLIGSSSDVDKSAR